MAQPTQIPRKIIVGLGNPGERYARTRHNVGFMVVDALAQEGQVRAWRAESQSLVSTCEIAGQWALLAKPLTFMNLSGYAIRALLETFSLEPESLIVILDDLNLPLGRIRVRERGSAGGHHGLQSVVQALGSDEVLRVRLGIGEENLPEHKTDFVLSDFPQGREAELKEMILRAREAVTTIMSEGISKAMSIYNAVTQ